MQDIHLNIGKAQGRVRDALVWMPDLRWWFGLLDPHFLVAEIRQRRYILSYIIPREGDFIRSHLRASTMIGASSSSNFLRLLVFCLIPILLFLSSERRNCSSKDLQAPGLGAIVLNEVAPRGVDRTTRLTEGSKGPLSTPRPAMMPSLKVSVDSNMCLEDPTL